MKFVSFVNAHREERLGMLVRESVIDLSKAAHAHGIAIPSTMREFLFGADGLEGNQRESGFAVYH